MSLSTLDAMNMNMYFDYTTLSTRFIPHRVDPTLASFLISGTARRRQSALQPSEQTSALFELKSIKRMIPLSLDFLLTIRATVFCRYQWLWRHQDKYNHDHRWVLGNSIPHNQIYFVVSELYRRICFHFDCDD